MNLFGKKERKDPEYSSMSAQSRGNENDINMKLFKSAFLNNSLEVKRQVRLCINNLIETLRAREEALCQQIDEHTLNLMYYKDLSHPWAYLSEPDTSPSPNLRIKLRFIEDFRNLAEELQQFGSIKVDTISPDNLNTKDSRVHEEPTMRSSSPVRTKDRETSPESAGSVESFEVIRHSDFGGICFQPVKKISDGEVKPLRLGNFAMYCNDVTDTSSEDLSHTTSIRYMLDTSIESIRDTSIEDMPDTTVEILPNTSIENIPDTNLTGDEPEDPVRLLTNQLKFYTENKSTCSKQSSHEEALPSLIVKKKFAEFLCKGEQEMWLASTDTDLTGSGENSFGGERSLDLKLLIDSFA